MYKAAAVLPILMKVYTIPCHDRGHINVILVLQSCTDSLQVLPGSSIGPFPTSSDGTFDVGNIKIEEDVDVIEESVIAINKEADIGIKQEKSPEAITFPDIKAEPDEVSYVFVCVLLDTFYQCPEMSFFFMSVFLANWKKLSLLGMKMFCCNFFFQMWGRGVEFGGVLGGSLLGRLVCMSW
jgi:hypothetical protein